MPEILIPYNQLSPEQKDIVRIVSRSDGHLYVEGPAGSGKTLISLHALKDIINSENINSILFLMYNHSLYGYLKTALEELNIITGTTIVTKDRFFWNLPKKDSFKIDENLSYEEKYNEVLSSISVENITTRYDIIIVDEIQDLEIEELKILKQIGTKIITLGDFNQKIYKSSMHREYLTEFCNTKSLTKIFRYDIDIAKLANPFTERDLTSMVRQGNGIKPKIIDVNENQSFSEILQILKNLTLHNKRTAIISPSHNNLELLYSFLKENNISCHYYKTNKELRNHDFTSTEPLLITSHSAKGLEFENVILFGFSNANNAMNHILNKGLLKEIIFVSITRCTERLFVVREPSDVELIKNLSVEETSSGNDNIDDILNDLF